MGSGPRFPVAASRRDVFEEGAGPSVFWFCAALGSGQEVEVVRDRSFCQVSSLFAKPLFRWLCRVVGSFAGQLEFFEVETRAPGFPSAFSHFPAFL